MPVFAGIVRSLCVTHSSYPSRVQMLSRRSDATLHNGATTGTNILRGEKDLGAEQLLVDNQVRPSGPDLCRTSSLLCPHRRIDRITEHRDKNRNNGGPDYRKLHGFPFLCHLCGATLLGATEHNFVLYAKRPTLRCGLFA